MGRRTVSVDVDVEVDIDDFDTGDLIDELEDRGYVVIDEKDKKAYETEAERTFWRIRQSYITDTPENFRKFLERQFSDMEMPV